MTAHSYSLRSRISSSSLNPKTPLQSPLTKSIKSPRKGSTSTSVLQLKHVIGTTTSTPGGLSCCVATNSYAYCAGSVAVLATVSFDNIVSYRYFKARPTAIPINQIVSYYDSPSKSNTPARRTSTFSQRRSYEDYGGSSLHRDWLDDGAAQTWSARERIKAASCVSLSPDGKILAVGETGYNPRVLLFSTAASIPTDTPLSIINDHTIGVRSVAFSPNSKYLATLGDVNDGFLYIWQVNTKNGTLKLHSSNKCTTNVCDMTWCGNSVVTVGTRHIKVWQALNAKNTTLGRKQRLWPENEISSPGPTPLQGRNCLLGAFVDATFTAVVTLSDDQAAICADDGHICLLDLSNGKTELSAIGKAETTVAAISCRADPQRLVWAGGGGLLEERDLDMMKSSSPASEASVSPADIKRRKKVSKQSLLRQSLGLSPPKRASIVALGCLDESFVCIDADGVVRVSAIETHDLEPDICRLASHRGVVKGVQELPKGSGLGSFLTWARDGEIRFWKSTGDLIRVENVDLDEILVAEDTSINELKVVQYSRSGKALITGDQFGIIKIIAEEPWATVQTLRAHSAEINSIDVHESSSTLATCSRDRTVQIFKLRDSGVDLVQTSDDHISAVNQVLFGSNGNRLLSCSADRTIVIRERIERTVEKETISAFVPTRTITLKAAPLSMSFVSLQNSTIAVSTMDRYIVKVDVVSGAILSSFKVTDRDTDDTVMLNSIRLGDMKAGEDGNLLAGYSAIDKSIRLYDFDKGQLLGRDSGHIEGISDIAMFEDDSIEGQPAAMTIVSTGLDSTVMIWTANAAGQPLLTPQQELSQSQVMGSDPEKSAIKPSPASLPPLRKVLSKLDIAEFSRHTSPTRENSPNGLRRKTSRLALTTSIAEAEEKTPPAITRSRSQEWISSSEKRSPSPPGQSAVRPKKQRSRSEMNRNTETKQIITRQSPSPPNAAVSGSTVARHSTRANNSRLRRPPSVPNDLRAQAAIQGRRQSTYSANDFGSIGMATEQTCRMLKAYGKKLHASRDDIDLNEVEADLESVLKVVRQKRAKQSHGQKDELTKITRKHADDDVNGLSVLLEKTSVS